MTRREGITGLVLAGGRGSRMGGADKGLLRLNGEPLVVQAMRRLKPQVDALMISANRTLEAYRSFGVPVVTDTIQAMVSHSAPHSSSAEVTRFDGPLSGMAAGLHHCATPWLACVPCDAPDFPPDLVTRLFDTCEKAHAHAAYAVERSLSGERAHPTFCLLHRDLRPPLEAALAAGQRRVFDWLLACGAVSVPFDTSGGSSLPNAASGMDETSWFANLNTLHDLSRAQRSAPE